MPVVLAPSAADTVVAYASLVPIVSIEVMGAPQPLILRKIAEASAEFFRLTRAYQFEGAGASLIQDLGEIALALPADTDLLEINRVEIRTSGEENGQPLVYLPKRNAPVNWMAARGYPNRYIVGYSSVFLYPACDQAYAGKTAHVFASIVPTLTATSVGGGVGVRYQDAIIEGAKARLLAMPRKDWYDPAAASHANSEFRRRINEARVLVRNEGSSEHELRVRGRFF